MNGNKATGVAAGAVGALTGSLAGFLIGRASTNHSTRKVLGRNYKLLSTEERAMARSLISNGHGYIFKAWPKPGVNDDAKRRLLTAAAAHMQGAGEAVEKERLSLLVPPSAEQRPKQLTQHNDTRQDKYYWLRDDDRKDPAVLSYLEAENAFTSAAMADTEGLQAQLYKEMRARIKEEDAGVATRYQGYYYYTRTEEGQQYALHCRRRVPAGLGPAKESDAPDEGQAEEVLLDENKRKEEGKHSFYMVGSCETSPNQMLLAWTEDTVGGEKYTLHVKDLATGKELMQPIPMTSGDVVWANDNATMFYTVKDHLDRPYKVLRHNINAAAGSTDEVVYEEPDESFYVGMSRSHSDRLVYIHIGSAVTNETRYLSADDPLGQPTVVLPRSQDVEYDVSHHPGSEDSLLLSSSSGAATGWFLIIYRDKERPNSEVRVARLTDPTQQTVLLPHDDDVKIEGASVGEKWVVVSQRSRAQQTLVTYALPPGGGMPQELANGNKVVFDEPAYTLSGGLTGDFESEVLRLSYSSLTTPPSIYDQHLPTGKRALKRVTPILGGFSREDYTTERLWATATDGTEVPISLVYRKGLAKKDGSDHMLLHGYGSYEYPYDPSFSRDQLSLIDRGWTVAIAHIRGGGDMGRKWYEDGKYLHKKNTFTDFIACAEHLIKGFDCLLDQGSTSNDGGLQKHTMKEKYTSADRLAIEGRSAGGLLMGAVTNMAPQLFSAVLMGVPFVDCLTTMLDETIPLTTIEWEEWGNPKDPEYYKYMKSYSPMDNVKEQAYPNILVTAGLHDPRVGYWEPAKLVARLRELKTDSNLLLLKTEMGAGHFSVTGRFERLKETAFEYAFLLKTAGMLDVKPRPGSASTAATAKL